MEPKTTRRSLFVSMLGLALLLIGGTAFAKTDGTSVKKNTYKITSKIFVDGQLVSSPQIVAYAGQKATIALSHKNEGQSLKLALVAKDIPNDNIKVSYNIQYNDGNTRIHSKPEMILVPNHEGVIHIASGSGNSLEMKVITEKQ